MSVQTSAEGGLPGPCYGATSPAAAIAGKMFLTAEVASQVAASLLVAPTFNPSTTRRQPMNPSANTHPRAAQSEPTSANFTPQQQVPHKAELVPTTGGRRILVAKPTEATVESTASRTLKTSTTSNGIVIVTATHLAPPPNYTSVVGGDIPAMAPATTQALPRHRNRYAAEGGSPVTTEDFAQSTPTGGRRRILPATATTITTTASSTFQQYGRAHQDPYAHAQPYQYHKSALNLSSETDASVFTNMSSEPVAQNTMVKAHHNLSSVNISTATTADDTDRKQQQEPVQVIVDDRQLDAPLDVADAGHIPSAAPRRILSVKSSPKKPSNSSMAGNSADLEVSPAPTAILALHNSTDNGSSRSASTGASGKSGDMHHAHKDKTKAPAIALNNEAPYRSSSPPPPPLRTGSPIDVLAAAGAIKIFRTPSPLPKDGESRDGTRSPLPGSPTTAEGEAAAATSFTYRYAHNPYGGQSPVGNSHSSASRGLSPTQQLNRPAAISTVAPVAATTNASFGNSPCQVASSMDELYHGSSAFAQPYPALSLAPCQLSESAPSSSPIGPKPPQVLSQQQTIFGGESADQPTSTKVITTSSRMFQFSAPPPLPPPSAVSPVTNKPTSDDDRPRAVSPTGGANGAHNPYFRPPPPMSNLLTSPTTNSAASVAALVTPTYATNISPYQWPIESEEDRFAASLTDCHPTTVQPRPTAVTARRIVPAVANPSPQSSVNVPTPTGRRIVSGTSVAAVQRPPSLFSNTSNHPVSSPVTAGAPLLTSPYTATPTGRRYHNGRPVAIPGGVSPAEATVVVTRMSY